MTIIRLPNESAVIAELGDHIVRAATAAIARAGVFRIGLSGGSLVKYLGQLAQTHERFRSSDWSKWQLFFCDERYVPESDADSTFGQYRQLFVPHTGLEEAQFLRLDHSLELAESARSYQRKIFEQFGLSDDGKTIPQFDLLLLGMGPDGHTCSLFPGHALLEERDALVAPIGDSPKPPPQRITMTYPLINAARACVFAMSGAGKADMVRRILQDKEPLPAGRVQPTGEEGQLVWILDEAAAEFVKA